MAIGHTARPATALLPPVSTTLASPPPVVAAIISPNYPEHLGRLALAILATLTLTAAAAWLWQRSLRRLVQLRTQELSFAIAHQRQEIEQRHHLEQRLQELLTLQQLALSGSDQGLWDWDLATTTVRLDEEWQRLLGYHPGEQPFNRRWWLRHLHPDSRPQLRQALQDYQSHRSHHFEAEFRLRNRSGQWRWFRARGVAVTRDASDQPLRMVGAHRDITDRKHAEARLKERERELRNLLDSAPQGMVIVDHNHRIRAANSALPALLDLPPERCQPGNHFHDLLTLWAERHEQGDELLQRTIRALARPDPYQVEFSHPLGEEQRWCLLTHHPIAEGGFVRTFTDITARKRAELEREQYFRLFTTAPDPMCIIDPAGRPQTVNPALVELLGYSEQELRATPLIERVHPEHRQATLTAMLQPQGSSGIRRFENRYLCKDGGVRWFSWRTVHDYQQGEIYATARDITERRAFEVRLAESENRLRTIVDTDPECVKLLDEQGRVIQMNAAGLTILEADSPTQVLGMAALDFVAPEYQQAYLALHQRVLAGEPGELEYETLGLRGRRRWLETHAVPMRDQGRVVHLAITRDISLRKQAEAERRLAASVFANSYEGIAVTDADNVIIDINPAFTRITGFEREEAIGQTPRLLASGYHPPEFYRELWRSLEQHGFWRGEIWNRRKSGEIYAEMLAISTVHDPQGRLLHYIATFTDISQLKHHQQELDRIAHYDPLTGLPNRRLLADRLHRAISQHRRTGRTLAVCYLDLDGFKPINDHLGHTRGDRLLVEIAHRLSHSLRGDDTLARLGGDEFILLIVDLDHTGESYAVLERVLAEVAKPVAIDGETITLSASIGVTLCPPDEADADALLRHADQAMYKAKEEGRNRYHLFDPEQDRQLRAHRHRLLRLQQALEEQEFLLHYQPRTDLSNGEVVGAEALIRWSHPQAGLLPPGEFLGHLEGRDLEIPLGEWVLEEALYQQERWLALGIRLAISVNISANHLLHPEFTHRLTTLLGRHPRVPPHLLELEILETAALSDLGQAAATITACHRLGVRFALDDFGTGYSSLSYLRALPVDFIKIDQSFVRNMLEDPNDFGIVESVVRLAEVFNRPAVAEGVESLEHGTLLLLLGCNLCQGYGIARPMPAAALPIWLDEWQAAAEWTTLTGRRHPRDNLPLLVAAKSHRKWVARLVNAIAQPVGESALESDPEQCGFGRWYRGAGATRYGSLLEYQAIGPLHEAVHRLGAAIIERARNGDEAAAEVLLPQLREASDDLTQRLEALIEHPVEERGGPGWPSERGPCASHRTIN